MAHGRAPTLLRASLYALLLLAVACTPARREVDGGAILRGVHFEGNGGAYSGHNDYQLRHAMEQQSTAPGLMLWPVMYFVEPKSLRLSSLPADAYRLEVWYAHHGYFDARVLGWQVRELRAPGERPWRRAAIVDLIGRVDPGDPSLVRTLDVEGLGASTRVLGRTALRNGPIQEGDRYDLEAVRETRDLLQQKLNDNAHAYATVELAMSALPEEYVVDVRLEADPGIVSVFGPVDVTGNVAVPTRLILENLGVREGDPYQLSVLQEGQRRLFGMGTFSIVDVVPDLSDPERADVPVHVRVTESKFRRLRLGVGMDLEIDGSASGDEDSGSVLLSPDVLATPRVSASFRHVNLLHSLIRFDSSAWAGFAYVTDQTSTRYVVPTGGIEAGLTYPRLFSPRVALELDGSYVQDVQSRLWAYRKPEADLAAVWRPTRKIQVRAGPHIELYDFLDDFSNERAARRLFGEGFVDPYRLTSLDQGLVLDWRDDPLFPSRHWMVSLSLREAFRLRPEDFSFGSATAEWRWYRPVKIAKVGTGFPLLFATKLTGTYLHPVGDSAIPYPEFAFLGGATDIRGFRLNQVGPYETLCTYEADGTTLDRIYHLPRGGTLAVAGSAELRYDMGYDITLATFADAGLLTADPGGASLEDVRVSAGVGARYNTKIWPLRLDVSVRPLYPEDGGATGNPICNDGDDQPRAYDLISSLFPERELFRPPLAVVFFLAIGESI